MVKTITITDNAYDAIKNMKIADESFSELFTRISNRQLKISDLAGALNHSSMDAEKFRQNVKKQHELLNEGAEERMKDVRARFKHSN